MTRHSPGRAIRWVRALSAAAAVLCFGCRPHPDPAVDASPAPIGAATAATASASLAPAASATSFDVEDDQRLVVTVGGVRRVALDLAKHLPARYFGTGEHSFDAFVSMHVEATGMFERDNVEEAVVSLFMGNACPNQYVLVRATAAAVDISAPFGSCSGTFRVKSDDRHDEFEVKSDQKTETFRPLGGRVLPVVEQSARAYDADVSVTFADVSAKGGSETLTVDLDGDGKLDSIECVCQQGLACTITSSDGVDWGTVIAPKRFGVLSSKTRGHRDLIIDQRTIMKFGARTYE